MRTAAIILFLVQWKENAECDFCNYQIVDPPTLLEDSFYIFYKFLYFVDLCQVRFLTSQSIAMFGFEEESINSTLNDSRV